ncbi:MAG: glycosyltransferase family 2 protein [Clostridia bacterium]|nr:glycosyltransferase family 2 protein [Bacillales bacterium]MBQ7346467.1 glycosyltransferase family 2 protein [Clostridia bacterium]
MILQEKVKETVSTDYGLVSIIMPNYNGAKYLKDTIDSVIAQTYSNWELLFVDDCSKDESMEIIRSYKDSRIRLLQNETNSGAAVSRNHALKEARGKWIAFLDSDDLWKKDKLLLHLQFLIENQISFSFTSYSVLNSDNDVVAEFTPKKDTYDYNTILKHCYIGCSTVIYDSEKFGKVYMPTDAIKREDFACWLKILKMGETATCFHENLTTYRVHNNSVSSNKFKIIKYQWNVYRNIERLSLLKSFFLMFHWAVKGFFKYK